MAEVRKVNIELPAELQPVFANMVRVAHTPGEFILDFTALLPGDLNPKVNARIVMSALGLKLLQKALTENIARYEASFGEIKLPPTPHSLADDLFQNSAPPQI